MLTARFGRFLADEDGAVTLDWLALTAAVAGVGVLGVIVIGQSLADISDELNAVLSETQFDSFTLVETPAGQLSSASDASGGALSP
jgi:Flp pilus assembly pilin Flp